MCCIWREASAQNVWNEISSEIHQRTLSFARSGAGRLPAVFAHRACHWRHVITLPLHCLIPFSALISMPPFFQGRSHSISCQKATRFRVLSDRSRQEGEILLSWGSALSRCPERSTMTKALRPTHMDDQCIGLICKPTLVAIVIAVYEWIGLLWAKIDSAWILFSLP